MVAFEVRSGSTHPCIFLTTDTFVKRIVNFLSGRWKQLQCFCSGSRGTERIALYLRAAKRPNCLQLLDRLYPLGGYPHAEASRQIHSGADDPRPSWRAKSTMKLRSIVILWKGNLSRYPSED